MTANFVMYLFRLCGHRFIVIVFPIRSRSVCTMSNCRRAVLIVWIVSLLLTAPVLFTKVGCRQLQSVSLVSRSSLFKLIYIERTHTHTHRIYSTFIVV